ncbi:unnamed protein product [Cuscuta campestris]|uniref:Late embryogenesis abundant protein LEA-2 subgroup domain-containing protein n=1 Tax=Cuscuta campestris TaxID=132261 RepID=A0A484MNG0_9ASTE|nr:unnamed protein product [Cuscuta campestris]
MHKKRETNPHFFPATLDPESPEPPRGPIDPPPQRRRQYRPATDVPPPQRPTDDPPQSRRLFRVPTPAAPSGTPAPPSPRQNPATQPPTPESVQGEFRPQRLSQQKPIDGPAPPQRKKRPPKPLPLSSPPARRQEPHPSSLRLPAERSKTNPFAWLIAACCTVFWVVVILGLLAVLIVYLVFRPRSPKFDLSSATLNAAYLDMGHLLNGDLTLLANFTNPNKKGRVEFRYAAVDLYHEQSPIASTYVRPFSMMNGEYKFREIHMVSSQVGLSPDHSEKLRNQIQRGRVRFEVKGLFRVKSDLGGFLQYSYWLNSHCTFTVTGPPTGVLIAKRCSTKR